MADNQTSQAPEDTDAGGNTPATQPQVANTSKAKPKRAPKEDARGDLVEMHGVKLYVKG